MTTAIRTLEDAIDDTYASGITDPLEIAREIIAQEDPLWLHARIEERLEEIVRTVARGRVNALRRAAEKTVRNESGPTQERAVGDLLEIPTWIPGNGFVRFHEFTLADVRARADYYENLAATNRMKADWLYDLAAVMEAGGYATVGDVPTHLLPETDIEPDELFGNGDESA